MLNLATVAIAVAVKFVAEAVMHGDGNDVQADSPFEDGADLAKHLALPLAVAGALLLTMGYLFEPAFRPRGSVVRTGWIGAFRRTGNKSFI